MTGTMWLGLVITGNPAIGDIARGENECHLSTVQIGNFALEQQMHMAVTGDVAVPPTPAPIARSFSCIAASIAGCWPMPR